MMHPNEETLLHYRFETLEVGDAKDVADHLRTCTDCAARFAALGKTVEKLDAWNVENELSPELIARVRERVKAAAAAKPEASAAQEPSEPEAPDRSVRSAERPQLGFLEWLGFEPGAPGRELRRAASLTLVGAAVLLGVGQAYVGAREVKINTVVTGERELLAGGRSYTRVEVKSLTTQRPNVGAQVAVTLVNGNQRTVLFEGKTDATGVAHATLDVPDQEVPEAELEVTAQARGEDDVVRQPVKVGRDFKVHLSTDKPLYQPGQTIHVRALALASPSLVPAAGRDLVFELIDSKGTRLSGRTLKASAYGVAAWDVELSSELALGEYTLSALMGTRRTSVPVKVARYTLPKFKLVVVAPRGAVLAGETLRADLHARYFFGKPVAKAKVHAVLVQETGRVVGKELNGATDGDGDLKLEFELPSQLAAPGLPEHLALQVEVTDAAGEQEHKAQAVVVSRELLSIDVLADQGGVGAGVPNTLYVLTTTPEGSPVPCDVTLESQGMADLQLRTAENGVGSVTLPILSQSNGIEVRATARGADGQAVTREFRFQRRTTDFNLDTDRALYRPGEPILVSTAGALTGSDVLLRVYREGRVVLSQAMPVSSFTAKGTINLPPGVTGSLELEATRSGSTVPVSRRVIVADPGGLKVTMTTDQETHQPGASARLRFEVKDANGKPKAAALGLSVVDESLWALTASSAAQARAFFLLDQSLQAPRAQLSAIDLLAGRQWSEADQLAARVLLSAPAGNQRPAAFEQETWQPKAVVLEAQRRSWNEFFGTAVWVLIGLFALAAMLAFNRFVGGWITPVVIVAVTFVGLIFAPWDWQRTVLVLGVMTYISMGVMQTLRRGGAVIGYLVVPALAMVFVTLFGDNIRRLFGMSADALAGDAYVAAPRHNSHLTDKTMKSFGENNAYGGGVAPEPAAMPPRAPTGDARMEKREKKKQADTGAAPAEEPPNREVRIRQNFPETMYVNPELVTDEAGIATLELPLADSITDWRMSAIASGKDGTLGTMDAPMRVFQDFFVDLDVPVALVRGDSATVPVAVHNYLAAEQTVRLEVKAEPWFEVVGPATFSLKLEAGAVGGQDLRIRVLKPGHHVLTLKADGTTLSDAVARELWVTEAGQQKTATVSGTLKPNETTTMAITVPDGAVPGSTSLMLKVFGSPLASALSGLEGSLQAPHGCFEQTSSTTYPNVLIWNYLKRTGTKNAAVEERARQFVALGYQRLLSFEVPGGGFEWFGRAPANRVLTAYGLMEFKDMAQVFPVDEKVISRTQNWLVSQQSGDGSWEPDRSSLSDGLWKSGFSGRLMVTAYVTWSLVESGYRGPALDAALKYLTANLNEVTDAYTLAMVAATFGKAGHPAAAQAVQKLVSLARQDKDQASYAPADATLYYSRGDGAAVETTALAAYGLMVGHQQPDLVAALVKFISSHRDGQGAWHSTQGTVLALRALLFASTNATRSQDVAVRVNGNDAGKLTLEPSAEAPAVSDLAAAVKPGLNVIEVTGSSAAQFQVVAVYTQPWREKGADASEPLSLTVAYGRTKAEVGAVVPVDLQVTYRGEEATGMVVVSLGVPAGLSPLPEDLDALVSSGAVARYELSAGAVSLYLDKLTAKVPQRLAMRLKARSKVETQGVGSVAYLYYHPTVRAVVPATGMKID